MSCFHFTPSFLVSLPFPRFRPLLISHHNHGSCLLLIFLHFFAGINFSKCRAILAISFKAFGSSLLPTWFHIPGITFAGIYPGPHVVFLPSLFSSISFHPSEVVLHATVGGLCKGAWGMFSSKLLLLGFFNRLSSNIILLYIPAPRQYFGSRRLSYS